MSNRPKGLSSTPFGRAAVPRPGQAMNLSDRILGQNKRKQKLSMASGTNPAKEGDKALPGAPSSSIPTGPKISGGSPGRVPGGLSSASAPFKHEMGTNKFNFGVGGPGFTDPSKP